jgi:hypothetical protein
MKRPIVTEQVMRPEEQPINAEQFFQDATNDFLKAGARFTLDKSWGDGHSIRVGKHPAPKQYGITRPNIRALAPPGDKRTFAQHRAIIEQKTREMTPNDPPDYIAPRWRKTRSNCPSDGLELLRQAFLAMAREDGYEMD